MQPLLSFGSNGVFCQSSSGNRQNDPFKYSLGPRAGLKVRGPGQFLLEGPYDVIHDIIVCTSCVFAKFPRFPFVFSGSQECAYSNAHTVSCEK